MKCEGSKIFMEWKNNNSHVVLEGDLSSCEFNIIAKENGDIVYKSDF